MARSEQNVARSEAIRAKRGTGSEAIRAKRATTLGLAVRRLKRSEQNVARSKQNVARRRAIRAKRGTIDGLEGKQNVAWNEQIVCVNAC